MPATPAHALRYPAPTDNPNIPLDLQHLAEDADAALTAVAPSGLIPIVTTLPGSPVDGQMAILSDAGRTFQWLCRYEAAASTYKWLVIGASPLVATVAAAVTTAATAYAALAGGPAITLPRVGIYHVDFGGELAAPSSAARMATAGPGYTAVDDEAAAFLGTATGLATVVQTLAAKTCATAGAITCQYKSDAAASTASFKRRWLRVRPLRVN